MGYKLHGHVFITHSYYYEHVDWVRNWKVYGTIPILVCKICTFLNFAFFRWH